MKSSGKKKQQLLDQPQHNESLKNPTNALKSLAGIALALPGISTPAQAQSVISTVPKADAFYSRYSENKNRYKIDSYETSILFPVNSQWEVGLGAVRDIMTGASVSGYYPQFAIAPPNHGVIIPGTSVEPAFLLTETKTGASIVDTRNQASALVNFYIPDGKISFDGGFSIENDFESYFGNLNTEWDFNKKNTVVFAGFGYAYNISRPAQRNTDVLSIAFSANPNSNRGKYHTERFNLGVKQDINKDFYVQQNAEVILDNGDLFDPYKSIAFNAPNILDWPNATKVGNIFIGSERRPKNKVTGAFVTSFVHYITCFNSSLHFNYRYAANTWNIHSNTFELAYYQPFLKTWEIAPKIRYYTQDRASFYALSYHTTPTPLFLHSKPLRKNKASSDYRLANFGSIGYDITLTKFFKEPNIKLSATFGFAKRATGYSLTKNKDPKNPSNQFHQKYVAVQLSSDFPQKLSFKKTEKSETTYKEGDISIQPLTISFTGITFGRKHKDTKFVSSAPFPVHTFKNSMYRNQRGFGLNDIHRNGLAYDFQLGYFIKSDIEVFADLGIINEKGQIQPTGFLQNGFQFKNRTSYRTNLGAKYYFDTKTIFTPFVGLMAGNIWQPKTKAKVYPYNPFAIEVLMPKIGTFEIFKSANLFNGALLAGLDYRFNQTFAVSLSTGLYYYQRNKSKTLRLPPKPGSAPSYRIHDNKNKFVVPVSISLKIIL